MSITPWGDHSRTQYKATRLSVSTCYSRCVYVLDRLPIYWAVFLALCPMLSSWVRETSKVRLDFNFRSQFTIPESQSRGKQRLITYRVLGKIHNRKTRNQTSIQNKTECSVCNSTGRDEIFPLDESHFRACSLNWSSIKAWIQTTMDLISEIQNLYVCLLAWIVF